MHGWFIHNEINNMHLENVYVDFQFDIALIGI